MIVTLPFPPSDFSGHNNGQWWEKNKLIATYRAEAFHETRSARRKHGFVVPPSGDIVIDISFFPPDNRGDRVNFPNRMKPQIDGIAEALGVNDKRFLPVYRFYETCKPGCVEVEIYPLSTGVKQPVGLAESGDSSMERNGPSGALTPSARDPISSQERTE